MSQNTLQELANSLGIKQRVAEMNEAQKAQLRYIQIMKSSTEWQTDMGRTLITPANTIRVMKEQVSLLAKAIGRVFIPIIMELMPYVMALTRMLEKLANKIANFLGYEISDVNYSGLGELGTLVGDIGDEAEKTTNKLNTMLAPFDELNVVQNKTKSASDGLGALGGDLGVDLPFYNALANLDKTFNENLLKAEKNLNNILKIVGLIGAGLLSWKLASWITSLSLPVGGTLFGGTITGMTKGGLLLKQLKIFAGISLIATGIVGNLYGINTDDFWGSILGKLGGSASLAGGTWMLTKNIYLTLGVTMISTTLGAIDAVKDLVDLEPTVEELNDYFDHIGTNGDGYIPVIGELTSFGQFLGKTAFKFTDFIDDLFEDEPKSVVTQEFLDKFLDIPTTIKRFNLLKKVADDNNNNIVNSTKSIYNGLPSWIKNNITDKISSTTNEGSIENENIIEESNQNIITKFTNLFDSIKQKQEESNKGFVEKVTDLFKQQNKTILDETPGITTAWETLGIKSKNAFDQPFVNIASDLANSISNSVNNLSNNGGFINTLTQKFKSIGTTLGNSLSNSININSNTVANNIQRGLTGIKFVDKVLGITNQLFQGVQIKGYEGGGYPESGQFFMARENGIPEMVGRIGNKTAVANNEQITTAITKAVVQGLSGFSRGNTPVTVYIGNDKIYEGYGQHVDDENDRYGTNVVHV